MHRYGQPPDQRPLPAAAPGGPSKAEPGGSTANGTAGAALIIGGLLVSGIEDQTDDDNRVGEA
jgi:hypothetical protein